ncbi:O-antigen ligase family protein [Aliarcobacter butzleri]|uniref:O-antigen ligase family protein n=1 Tax=Aliarcobacter butzleri TaxID=28197 RepID=UPI001918F166|nr:O-antigen ligase family protein [Aliarcobacter butzleri]
MAISLIEIFFGFHLLNSEHNFHSLAIKSYIPTAFFQNENLLGTYIVLWVIPFLYSYLYNNNPKNLSVWLMLILYLYVLLETSSRANFLALIIGFIYIFVFLLNKKKSFFIFLIIFPFLFFAFLQLNSLLDESEYENITSVSIRLDLSIFAIKIFFDSFLLGAGAGSIELLVKNNNFDFGITNIHNYWLEILANFGIIGLLLYFVFYFVILMNIFNIKKRFINNKYVKFITDGLFISLLMFPISIISNSSVIFNPIIMIYFGFIITFINVYSKVSSKYEK